MSRSMLDSGSGSLDSPLHLPVTDCLCDPYMFLTLSSCHVRLSAFMQLPYLGDIDYRSRRAWLSELVGSSRNREVDGFKCHFKGVE